MNEKQNAEQSQQAQAAGSELKGSVRRWRVFFKGGDEDRPHEEVFGLIAENEEDARIEALRIMREDFMIRYPEIYRIEDSGWA